MSCVLCRAAGGTDRGTALIDLIDDQADQIGQQTDEAPVQPGELALGSISVHPQSNQHPVDTEKQHCECRRNLQRSHPAGNGGRNGDNVDPAAVFMNIHAAEQIDRLGSKTTFKGAVVVVVCTELSKNLVDDGIQHEFLALDILEHGIRICRRGEILFLRAYLCKLQRSAGKLGVFCGKVTRLFSSRISTSTTSADADAVFCAAARSFSGSFASSSREYCHAKFSCSR